VRGLDSNVLLRFLVQDDLEQLERAARFIAIECTIDNPGLINHIVLCELFWVLNNGYGFPREKVSFAIDLVMHTPQLRVDRREEVSAALSEYQAGCDFADALIAIVNQRLGCDHTVTFDRKAGRRAGFRAL
jgi:predicted nucleic-acid-binding protein